MPFLEGGSAWEMRGVCLIPLVSCHFPQESSKKLARACLKMAPKFFVTRKKTTPSGSIRLRKSDTETDVEAMKRQAPEFGPGGPTA